jgi:hypothetical protein
LRHNQKFVNRELQGNQVFPLVIDPVIPIYVRGGENKDPRQNPTFDEDRPQGQRTNVRPLNRGFNFSSFFDPQGDTQFQGGGFVFNVGFFPFFPQMVS